MLRVKDLHAGYSRVPVLHGISLDVSPGEIVLVLGPNGAGKTTLLKTIGGFIKPSQGEITLDNEPLGGKKPEHVVRAGVRLVLEGHRIFPELTVAENLQLGQLALKDPEVFEKRVEAVVEIFPIINEKMHSYARDLSGGQQQILALAQSFIPQPQFLMCDEPSQGIALALIPNILRFLRKLADAGMGILVVEQLPETALAFADRVLVIQQGAAVAQGPADELRNRGDLKKWLMGL